jgi:hypothetical protein
MRTLLVISILLGLPLAGCHRAAPPAGPLVQAQQPRQTADLPPSASKAQRAAWRKAQREAIYEAVVRRALLPYAEFAIGEDWPRRLPECVVFLRADNQDVSATLLKRFAGERPVIRRVSEATDWKRFAPSTPEGRPLFLGAVATFSIGELHWTSDAEATVQLGAHFAPRSHAWWGFIVVRDRGRWVVRDVVPHGVT